MKAILNENLNRITFEEFCQQKFGCTLEEHVQSLISILNPGNDTEKYENEIRENVKAQYTSHIAHVDYVNAGSDLYKPKQKEDSFAAQYRD